MDVASRSYFVL